MNEENKKVILNEKLQEVLDGIGSTPIDEPKLAKIFDEKPLKKVNAIKLAFKGTGLKIKDFSAMDIANFYKEMVKKVTDRKYEDGTYKSTPKTENYRLPNFEEVEDLYELLGKLQDNHDAQDVIQKQIKDGENVDNDKIETVVKELNSILEDLDNLVWSISGLKKEELSDWEQTLVSEQIISSATEVEKTSLGKL